MDERMMNDEWMNVQDEVFNEENESASNISEDARMEEPLQVRVSSFLLFTLLDNMHYLQQPHMMVK